MRNYTGLVLGVKARPGQGHLILGGEMPILKVEGEIQPRGMAMEQSDAGMSLWEVFGGIPDHRDPSGQRFSLQSILAITLAAMLAGRSNLASVGRWGRKLTRKG